MATPTITTTDTEIIIRIPKDAIGASIYSKKIPPKKKKGVDFSYLIGLLKDVPEFKGKTSVEVQHMISDLWASKYSS
ncbi:hypothetical protein A3B21_03195 [Candidatus Uhrbacteria bacterium RIFCSPLOWO2_01_FULL_47_24]|uniref:Uncharacterized protein n=1 Tax=Candidatus Uhrbacteria bacterium RIFCSPLOWO2_01_FULL_47_24 TaxID=1802401 RepID=A0A1F7UTE8_9BACT|nr:MAG: hypothetical protein A2753_05125 [Candidatus Uhrbacteria bacterium RIFCSPHIGHO2_01_FULL_47_11]OGL67593.1 MAG: hypothetical protein A3D58_03795 [Candidatus Uhrbacteria bacterium RIFCSPHIGHO2_02_FULL_46_47]OGL75784.1 MAG: hypothetical protein A3F52_05610 [Candidatus Uhrbacteria bacterium RIFCSPHIGHO2_12_FULL_47_11]OGL80947.1 MAG: hypothetical protein A3B21_03195 [Candidatus Uhrbacteria bacterium RIFCSPLOWO2_01_FULL_47_24]OGL84282.1 MAG: hypothetical protein A3J03_03195 [Candidatus Uhrbact